LVALNKIDLVDSDWLEMVMLDIEEELAGSFLEGCDIMPVSAHSGQGLDELKQKIFSMLQDSPPKRDSADFRMPIDRVFTMDGFGTVVTGTLIEGSLAVGDDVELMPSGLMTKARRIQVHGELVEKAFAGQRVAVNLAGLKVSDINRGDWATKPASLENSRLLDVVLEIDKNMEREIKSNSRLHLYHGTRDILCNLLLLNETKLTKGQRAYGQLRLTESLPARAYDRFVLRFYSPMETVGGGIILDPLATRMKRGDAAAASRFEAMERGTLDERVAVIFAHRSPNFPKPNELARVYFRDEGKFDKTIQKLIHDGILIDLGGQIIHKNYLNILGAKAGNFLNHHHAANPLHAGMTPKELTSRLLPGRPQPLADAILAALIAAGAVKKNGAAIAHKDFKLTFTPEHAKIEAELTKIYQAAAYAPPDQKEIATQFSKTTKEKKAFDQMFAAMTASGELVALTPQIHIHKDHYAAALDIFKTMAASNPQVLTKDYRDTLDTSRKFALAILEHFDKQGMTKMIGEGRILLS
ncbi:MAG: SelB C-terminal domain-containing protein, partial [Defluviitaleaceae bacterium]|nr:SelB C-terminal domain-containing protein [Defluviitaleaceae bacterium]